MIQEDKKEQLCYWCGNTGVTWYEDHWNDCVDHEYREGELSIYAKEAIKQSK